MQKNAIIYNELKEVNSLLANISNKNVYTVPDGYFDSLSDDILHSIRVQFSNNEIDRSVSDLKVPDGYFNGLADEIMAKIKLLEQTSDNDDCPAFLANIRHHNVYSVPEGYFDGLAENVVGQLPSERTKIVAMKPRTFFFKYAIAACITGMIGLSLFSLFDNKSGSEISSPAINIAQSDITLIKAKEIIKNNSFDKNMEALNVDDIVQYLQSNGEDVNAALVASVTDEKSLPNEEAYFLDDKALDNFLNELHITQAGSN